MRPLESLLFLVNFLTYTVLIIPRFRAVRWTRYSGFMGLLVASAQSLMEGPRWQMIPAYVLAGIFFLVRLRPISGRNRPGLLSSGMGALGLAVSALLPSLLPVFRFPRPTGPYGVGTLTYHWVDAARDEVFSTDPDDRRELMVQIWYPAREDPSAPRAPYLQDADAPAPTLARLYHLPAFIFRYFKYITTNAVASAPVADNQPRYPVLLFLEGLTGVRQMNTFQVEELVSHGYIVAALDQPYAAAAVVFPDGHQVGVYPDMLSLVRQSLSSDASPPILNDHEITGGIIRYLAHDVSFTLNQLAALNQADPNGILTGRLDLQHAGIFGVSLGGMVVGEACRSEPRLQACLVLDAHAPPDVVREGLRQPTMWISRDVETLELEGWAHTGVLGIDALNHGMRAVFESLPTKGYIVRVPGAFHLNFTDTPYYSPLTPLLRLTGPIDAQRAHRITNAYALAFFNRHLKGEPEALLDGPAEAYPEVIFERHLPSAALGGDSINIYESRRTS